MKLENNIKILSEKLEKLKKAQMELNTEFKELENTYVGEDVSVKYNDLLVDYHELKDQFDLLMDEKLKLEKGLNDAKRDIYFLGSHEKKAIMTASRSTLDAYYSNVEAKGYKRIKSYEKSMKYRIDQLEKLTSRDGREELTEINMEIKKLRAKVEANIIKEKNKLQKLFVEEKKNLDENYNNFNREKLTNEQIGKRLRGNQWELIFGLNWLNKIGIILILLGVVTAFKYSYSNWFNEYAKGALFFLLGAGFLYGGEYFAKKDKKVFSLGLIGGGVGILYASTFFSYFLLDIINMWVAMFISILITGVTVLLSIRHDSKTISILSLIGGYLPIISYIAVYDFAQPQLIVSSIYIVLLNGIVLMNSFKKRWLLVSYTSYLLHLPYLVYINTKFSDSYWNLLYTAMAFIIYLAITIIYPYRNKKSLADIDMGLIALNTLISFSLNFRSFSSLGIGYLQGLLTLAYGLVFFLLARKFTSGKEKQRDALLYYGTTLAFAIAVVPIQFDQKFVIIGWLLEGFCLVYLSLLKKEKKLFYGGSVIFFLSQLAFYTYELPATYSYQFAMQLKFLIVVATAIAYFYYVASKFDFELVYEVDVFNIYRNSLIIVFAIYLLNITSYILSPLENRLLATNFYIILITIFFLLYSYLLENWKLIKCRFSWFCAKGLNLIAIVNILVANLIKVDGNATIYIRIIYLLILLGFNIVVMLYLFKFIKEYKVKTYTILEYMPLVYSGIILTYAVSFMGMQLNLDLDTLLFSIILSVYAIGNLIYGFRYNYRYLRYASLAVVVLTITKTFLFDLVFITTLHRIVAFFTYGAILIGISYIYQRLTEKFEVKNSVE